MFITKSLFMKTSQLLYFLLSLIFLASCSSGNNDEIIKYSTDKTLGISRVNLQSFSDKIPFDKILKEKTNLSEGKKEILQLLSKPEESGIDIAKPLYFMIEGSQNISNPEVKIFFSLKDKNKFQSKMSQLTKQKMSISDKGSIYLGSLLIGSIKDDYAVLAYQKDYNYSFNLPQSSANSENKTVTEQYFEDFWNRKGISNSTLKDQINKTLTKNKDISLWINIAATASYATKGYIETLTLNKLLIDSGFGIEFNFDKGKIEMETQSFFNKDMKKIIEKYYNKNKINYDLVKYTELDNAEAFSLGFFSLDFFKYLIQESGFEATINNYLGRYGNTTLEDVTSSFTGDFASVEYKNSDPTAYSSETNITILGINPQKTDKINALLKNNFLFSSKKPTVIDNLLILGGDDTFINQIKNKKEAKNSNLDKKSGINSCFWSNGRNFNKATNKANIVDWTGSSKEEDGNMISEASILLDKKDENALYYLLVNE